jgi:hypothetical protein
MRPLGELLVSLAGELGARAESAEAGLALAVTELDVVAPLEARLGAGAELTASLPRGRMATGFDPPLGRLTARFRREPA